MSRKGFFLVALIVGACLLAGYCLYVLGFTAPLAADKSSSASSETTATPLDPLADVPAHLRALTILGLREREYHSTLTIDEELEVGSNYRAYLAEFTSDGSRVYGLLTIPTGEMPAGGWPAIVLMHGYVNPATYQTNGSSYRGWWQAAAHDGRFVIFKPDMRGHGQSEGVATGPYYSADYVIDALNARSALAGSEFINSEQIGFWGHSMSGNTLLRAAAAAPDIPALALWAGAVYTYQDLIDYWISDPSYSPERDRTTAKEAREASASDGLFDPHRSQNPDFSTPFWRAMIPTNYLDDLQGAIIIHHAVDDTVVSSRYSEDLNALLDQTNIPHEYYTYPSGGHNLTGATFNSALSRTLDFFDRYLNHNRGDADMVN